MTGKDQAPFEISLPRVPPPNRAFLRSGLFLLLLLAPSLMLRAASPPGTQPADLLNTRTPRDWVVQTAHAELDMIQFSGVYIRYRIHMVNSHGDQIRDIVESRDGTVARMIYKDNRPLTPDEDRDERDRLQDLLDSPSAFARHVRGDVSGKKLAVDLVQLIPDAMNFTYVPGQPQIAVSNQAAPQIVLDFTPNPKWHPPTMSSEALTGIRGRIWIDSRSGRMLRLDAELFQAVNFGWGMVAHLYPGGHFMLEQTSVPTPSPDQRWIFSRFVEQVTVRALLVKTVKENNEIGASNFQVIPAMSYQQAIHLLLDTPLPTHQP